jgi:hypothetical protein
VSSSELWAINCADRSCSVHTNAKIVHRAGFSSGVAIDRGNAVIAYMTEPSTVHIATCPATACAVVTTDQLDKQPSASFATVAVGPDGPLVTYCVSDIEPGHGEDDTDLKVARPWLL